MSNRPDSPPIGAPFSAKFPIRPVLAVVGAGSLDWGRIIGVDLRNNPDLEFQKEPICPPGIAEKS